MVYMTGWFQAPGKTLRFDNGITLETYGNDDAFLAALDPSAPLPFPPLWPMTWLLCPQVPPDLHSMATLVLSTCHVPNK